MRVFFLSDIHLCNGESPQARRLVAFLSSEPSSGDLVVLGGDIFDLFVGNKRVFRRRFSSVLEAIEAAGARGVELHYLEGNHDFHFSKMFDGKANIRVHFDDYAFTAHNRRVLVSHGDLIDKSDYGYRFLRWFTKNFLFELFVRLMPDFFVDFVGRTSSKKSRDYTTTKGSDLQLERVRNLYVNFAKEKIRAGTDHVLVGHSHLRDQVAVKDGPHRGEYINLGYAHDRLIYGVLEQGSDRFELKELA